MGAMKELSIEIDEIIHTFEENFRVLSTSEAVGRREATSADQAAWAARSDVYDAFYDLVYLVRDTYSVGDQPKESDDHDPATLGQLRELSAQVAALAEKRALAEQEAEEELEVELTGQTLHVMLADGTDWVLKDVGEFYLSLDGSKDWPVGWVLADEDDPASGYKAGYWTDDAEFHAFDSRYRNRDTLGRQERVGW